MADTNDYSAMIESLRKTYEGIRDERRTYTNTATRIGNAFLALLEYLLSAPYLRKDKEDSTPYLLKLLAGCTIGDSDNITINPDGSITCGSIRVNGSAIFDELVFNHQNILEGDTYFTDRGIIDAVTHLDVNQYTLTFRKEYSDEVTTFKANDILLGKINNLDKDRTFRSFWLRVESVDTNTNTAVCTMYDGDDVPGGTNYQPVAGARVIRWGNTVDTSRQSCWFVSSTDGRWLFLQGVSKPVLEDSDTGSNYAGFIGLPPDIAAVHDLIEKGVITQEQPYVYFRGLLVQDIIKVDYKGNPQYTARDLGKWNSDTTYIKGYDTEARGYYVDRCWHGGCLWQCNVTSSKGSEPRYNNTDWTCLLGSENIGLSIESTAGNFFRANTNWTTHLVATVYNADMALSEDEIGKANVTWTRESGDSTGDAAWNLDHVAGKDGLTLAIDSKKDLPSTWSVGSSVGYTCTVSIPNLGTVQNSYSVVN